MAKKSLKDRLAEEAQWEANRAHERAMFEKYHGERVNEIARANGVTRQQAIRLMSIQMSGASGEDQLEALRAAQRNPNW